MKNLIWLGGFAAFLFVVGCADPEAPDSGASAATEPAATQPETDAATDSSHDLVAQVDAAGFQAAVDANAVTIVDFSATWCGPCQMLKPKLHEMADEFSSKAKFIEVDVDKNQELAQKYEVAALPTILVIKGGEESARVVGADLDGIRSAIEKAL